MFQIALFEAKLRYYHSTNMLHRPLRGPPWRGLWPAIMVHDDNSNASQHQEVRSAMQSELPFCREILYIFSIYIITNNKCAVLRMYKCMGGPLGLPMHLCGLLAAQNSFLPFYRQNSNSGQCGHHDTLIHKHPHLSSNG